MSDEEITTWTDRELLANMLHGIRNPASIVLGYATLLRQSWEVLSAQERNEMLDQIITRMRIINEVNDWSFIWRQSHSD